MYFYQAGPRHIFFLSSWIGNTVNIYEFLTMTKILILRSQGTVNSAQSLKIRIWAEWSVPLEPCPRNFVPFQSLLLPMWISLNSIFLTQSKFTAANFYHVELLNKVHVCRNNSIYLLFLHKTLCFWLQAFLYF